MILVVSLMIIFVVFTAFFTKKLNIPLILISLLIGIIFGSDVTGIIYFDDAQLTKRVADIALIFVLFSGGFSIKYSDLKTVMKPVLLLSTVGVVITAVVSGFVFWLISGWDLTKSILLCSIISSTDAAAVFSILRTKQLNKDIALITEAESASNDPMAVVLTTFIIQLMIAAEVNIFSSIIVFFWQFVGGTSIGILIGFLATYLFNKIRDIDIRYYYLFLIGVILFTYGLANSIGVSGMLSVFFAGLIMGKSQLPHKNGLTSFIEILSFISYTGLFILLGLLVFPRSFSKIWLFGILLFVLITFVGRPIAVFLCTFFGKLSLKDKIFLNWSGIRGAVPVVLATYPMAVGIDNDHQIFNTVFFAVTLSIIIQGTTIAKLADMFGLAVKAKNKVKQKMELVTVHDTNYEMIEIFIDDEIYQGECKISDLSLPAGTTITMINREDTIIAPSGQTVILPGDTLYVLVNKEKVHECINEILGMFPRK